MYEKKKKGGDFRVYVATSFAHPVFCEIEALAKDYGLANAQVVRELFLRGLAAYHRDGKISELAEETRCDAADKNGANESPANILAVA